MPITTTDVVTNVVSGVETSNNGYIIVTALRTGEYQNLAGRDSSISYATLESRYTERFDDVSYFFIGNNTVVGG